MVRQIIGAFLVLSLWGCGAMKPAPIYRAGEAGREAELPRVVREDLLNEISLYHGAPYREGGTSMTGVDCSGLVQVVFTSLGLRLPRTVAEQYGHGIPVSSKDVRTGDLVFFGGSSLPSHVGIAISTREMIHASSSGGVVVESIDAFAGSMRLVGIRRIVRLD